MNKERLKIGVDIDGVLIDTDIQEYMKFCEQELGWNVNYERFSKTHSWFDATGQTSVEVISKAFERFIIEVEESQKPIEGAHDALKKIGEIADVFLITARVGELQPVTEKFLKEHLQDVAYHEISMGNVDKKARRIIDFNLDYFVDDSYREISMILKNKSVDAKIIPFPGFHGRPTWEAIDDDRIHWLSIWEQVKHDLDLQQQSGIRRQAWEEIAQVTV